MLKSVQLLSERCILTEEEITGRHTDPTPLKAPPPTTPPPPFAAGPLDFMHFHLFVSALDAPRSRQSAGPLPPGVISRYTPSAPRPQLSAVKPVQLGCQKNRKWLLAAVAVILLLFCFGFFCFVLSSSYKRLKSKLERMWQRQWLGGVGAVRAGGAYNVESHLLPSLPFQVYWNVGEGASRPTSLRGKIGVVNTWNEIIIKHCSV